jgi:hypothetical protein
MQHFSFPVLENKNDDATDQYQQNDIRQYDEYDYFGLWHIKPIEKRIYMQ